MSRSVPVQVLAVAFHVVCMAPHVASAASEVLTNAIENLEAGGVALQPSSLEQQTSKVQIVRREYTSPPDETFNQSADVLFHANESITATNGHRRRDCSATCSHTSVNAKAGHTPVAGKLYHIIRHGTSSGTNYCLKHGESGTAHSAWTTSGTHCLITSTSTATKWLFSKSGTSYRLQPKGSASTGGGSEKYLQDHVPSSGSSHLRVHASSGADTKFNITANPVSGGTTFYTIEPTTTASGSQKRYLVLSSNAFKFHTSSHSDGHHKLYLDPVWLAD